jgi:hypothetical protein
MLGSHHHRNFTDQNVEYIYNEINKDDALYYIGDALNRFVVRAVVRLHPKDVKLISRSLAMTVIAENKKKQEKRFSKMKRLSSISSSGDYNTVDSYLGSVFELCCAYKYLARDEKSHTTPKQPNPQMTKLLSSKTKADRDDDSEYNSDFIHFGLYNLAPCYTRSTVDQAPFLHIKDFKLQSGGFVDDSQLRVLLSVCVHSPPTPE